MNYPKKELAQLVIAYCVAYDIEDVVISPGSRNAPLTIGFANHPKINAYSIADERCAAFFALGLAQQKQKPVAVVCTSGSALLNYYPALAEAFYSNIPLVVISADRPKHLIDIGDGQTIRQENVFDNHSLFNANLIDTVDQVKQNMKLLQEALKTAVFQKGPVHINVPFDEPLYETTEKLVVEILPDENIETKVTTIERLHEYADIWNTTQNKMILVGANYPDNELQKLVNFFATDRSVIVLTETTSNVHHHNFINSIDKLIIPFDDIQFKRLQPTILLTFGGMIVSKKVKQFLRSYKPKRHWHIDPKTANDTYHSLDRHVKHEPIEFFKQFIALIKPIDSFYQQQWLQFKNDRVAKHNGYIATVDFSDLKVFDTIFKTIPNNVQLQLGNSSVVRYSQLFDINSTLKVFCNRGTSGIDGSTSTAVGASLAQNEQTVCITGDISFFYDSNALWNNYIKNDFRIILINNTGGGIFRFIPGPTTTNALNYFETNHNLNAKYLCDMFGFEYYEASNEAELEHNLKDFYSKSAAPRLLEIKTPRLENDKILKKYFECLK